MQISIKILKNGVKNFKKCQNFHENERILPKNEKFFPFFKHFYKFFVIFAKFSIFFPKNFTFFKNFGKFSIFLLIFYKFFLIFWKIVPKIWFFNQNIENFSIIYTFQGKFAENFGNLLEIVKILGNYWFRHLL